MKCLVTGGAGFIGSSVVRQAVAAGHAVVNVDKLTYAANLDNLAPVAGADTYRFVQIDICDADAVAEVFATHRPDWVMHLAAESHVDRSIDGPGDFIQTNVVGSFVMLQAARAYYETLPAAEQARFRFLHVSTDEVYGSLGASGLFTEETPYAPNSPYSASKASSDMLARAWRETYGLPVIVSNCSNNYGPYQFPEKLIPVVILNALAGEPIPVYGEGLNVRDWLYVDDHAAALFEILEKGEIGETYNVGGHNEVTNIDLVRLLCRLLDEAAPRADGAPYADLITFVTDRPGHDQRYAIDASKIGDELGWRPSVTLEEGMRLTVAWYLENETWWRAVRERGVAQSRRGLDVQAKTA